MAITSIDFGASEPLSLGDRFIFRIGEEKYECARKAPPRSYPAVTPFSQNDSRWAGDPFSGESSHTFSQSGCFVVAVAMILSLVNDPPLFPDEVAKELREVGAFDGSLLNHPARIPTAFPSTVWGGALHWRVGGADLAYIRSELQGFGSTILELKLDPDGPSPPNANQHFVIAEGYKDSTSDLEIVDPYDGRRKLLKHSRYVQKSWPLEQCVYGIRCLRPFWEPYRGTAVDPNVFLPEIQKIK